ncbi:MAG: TraB/GumN family protein [Hyphomonadaceae bacterium]
MRRLLAAAFALLLSAPACAQGAIRPALFVMRDADSTIYLFGTVHVRRPGAPWGGPEAVAALAQSQTVRTEIEMSPEADARAAAQVQQIGMAGPNDPLSSHLTPQQNVRVAAALAAMDVRPDTLEAMRPWYAGLVLSMLPIMRAGYDPAAGVDRQIDAAADAQQKQMRWFETSAQQLNFIAGLSAPLQVEMVMEGVGAVDEGVAQLGELERAWEEGDLDKLERFVVEETRQEFPELYQALFVARNHAFVEVLSQDMAGAGSEFVAIGAGHLLGPDGVIALLRARGFAVERVNEGLGGQ